MPMAVALEDEGECVVVVLATMGALVAKGEAIIQKMADAAASHRVAGAA